VLLLDQLDDVFVHHLFLQSTYNVLLLDQLDDVFVHHLFLQSAQIVLLLDQLDGVFVHHLFLQSAQIVLLLDQLDVVRRSMRKNQEASQLSVLTISLESLIDRERNPGQLIRLTYFLK
jgi:hypothetical protein